VAPAALAQARRAAAAEGLGSALVLSGGGAKGAYQAGIIGALAASAGIADGTALPPYELVCGTSIGALNGWFVATAQYTKLRELWYGISAVHVITVKKKYEALRDPQSGALDRAAAAVNLFGLLRNDSGLLQSAPAYNWIAANVDPATPLVMPFVWAVTNLTHQRPEYFILDPQVRSAEFLDRATQALRISLGPQTIVREATPELLHQALFASAAIPIAFDPVLMPGPDGTINAYCDGGVASNSSVGIAHSLARGADVILLSPPFQPESEYDDAISVAFGAFGTAERKILEVEMRNAYFQSVGKRLLKALEPSVLARVKQGSDLLTRYVDSIPETNLRYIRPSKPLPVDVVAFDDELHLGQAYRIGWEDAAGGFTEYDWETFDL
jgi:predicted acylesterase/phospholipase RssA